AQEVDIGIALLTKKPEAGMQARELAHMPLVLLVAEGSGITRAEDLLGRDRIDLPLITLGAEEGVCRAFQAGLRERGVDWVPSLELGGLDLVARYVSEGFGVGVSLRLPGCELPEGVRELPLDGFPQFTVAAIWAGRLSPLGEMFTEVAASLAGELFGT
ncbi:MAG: LysR substrate-binding domain-containing protein, partial [Verrucomicrobium sp.]